MRILPLLFSSCILLGMSGCTKTDEHCKAGEAQTPEVFLTDTYLSNSQLESGVRTYTWDLATSRASTNGIAQTIIRAYIDGNDVVNPITLSWQRVLEGSESNVLEIVAHDTSLSSVYSYELIDQSDFSLTHNECEVSYEVRAMLSFPTTGQESSDDAYLAETVFGHSSLKLLYFLEED